METKRSRENESDDSPDAKKVRAELIRLLDDTDVKGGDGDGDGDFLYACSPAEGDAAEEDVVGVMRSLEEEILLGPSISAETSVSEKEFDVPAIDSSNSSTIFDPLMDEEGFLATTFPDDLDFAPSGSERQGSCQVPEPGEVGLISSGSPLGYLLGASDDELGLPPAGSSGQQSPRSPARPEPPAGLLIDNWQFDDELQAMRVPGLEFCEPIDNREDAEDGCGFGGLFDHSDVADGSFVVFSGDAFS